MSDTHGEDSRAGRPLAAARERQRRRIRRATRGLAVGGVAASVAFFFAAAHGTRSAPSTADSPSDAETGLVPSTSGDDSTNSAGDDDGWAYSSPGIAPSQDAPTPSYVPPVARSGGS